MNEYTTISPPQRLDGDTRRQFARTLTWGVRVVCRILWVGFLTWLLIAGTKAIHYLMTQ